MLYLGLEKKQAEFPRRPNDTTYLANKNYVTIGFRSIRQCFSTF